MTEYPAASAPVLSQHLRQQRAAPLALVAEQAGGRASTGTERILEIVASGYHQRVPLLIGGAEEIGRAEALYRSRS
jgi:fructose-1,6-bisphosphatase I